MTLCALPSKPLRGMANKKVVLSSGQLSVIPELFEVETFNSRRRYTAKAPLIPAIPLNLEVFSFHNSSHNIPNVNI